MITPRDTKQHVDKLMKELLATRQSQAKKLDKHYAQLWTIISEVALAGGKRIRPYLVNLAYEAIANEPVSDITQQAGLAVELFHIAILMHDDIIDRDATRHGQPNVSGRYQTIYSNETDHADTDHFADSSALIAGDLLLSEAYATLASIDHPRAAHVRQVFFAGVFDVCGGELLDTEAPFRSRPADALTICSLKTASYSFVMPLTIGAVLADAKPKQLEVLRQFAEALGTAFQLADDLLGVFGDIETTGKSTISDIREGKLTYMVEQFFSLASIDQKKQFSRVFGQPDQSDEDYKGAAQLLIDSGAKSACQKAIDRYIASSVHALDQLDFKDVHRQAFLDLITRCTRRES